MNSLEKSIQFIAKHFKPNAFNPDAAWEKVTGQPKRILLRPAVWRSIAAVAVVLIVVGTIFLRPTSEKVLTAHEIQKISVLLDESKITLEPGAKLTYAKDFGKENRRVSLSGKAKFEVARNEGKPFSVQTTSAEITVLGTVFDVNSTENQTTLEVHSGKVLFAAREFPVTFVCTRDMQAAYKFTEKELTVSSTESSCTINLHTNLLKFNNMQLDEVARILSEYFDVKISIADEEKNLHLTSTFENKNIQEVLEIINLTLESEMKLVVGK